MKQDEISNRKNKLKLGKELKLDKQAITKLQETQIDAVKGGVAKDTGPYKTCIYLTCNPKD